MTKKAKDIEVSSPTPTAAPAKLASMDYKELDRLYPNGIPTKTVMDGYWVIGFPPDTEKSNNFAEFQLKGKSIKKSGWKAHFSVNPNNLGAAWDLAYPLMLKFNCKYFKVIRQSAAAMSLNKSVATGDKAIIEQDTADITRLTEGAQITLYICEGEEGEAQKWFKEIDAALAKAKLKPGKHPKSDRVLGKYCSIRHEGAGTHDQATDYKPAKMVDPFKSL